MTPRSGLSPTARRTGTYVVCLDCGKEFPYDWKRLRMERPDEAPQAEKPQRTASPRRPVRQTAAALLQPLARLWS
ncbi:MAG: hypothetical protein IT158_00100 [Bryobacterales bacterium]|nr:hypothetical protein [Bryobacterales bacterium]